MKKFSKEQLDKIINNSFKAGTQNNLYYLSEETFRQMKKDKRFVQTYKVRTDIANEMLNLIDKSVWHNKNAKVLQLAGMSDDFFSLMFSRFYFGLASEIPDRYERAQYILDNNIYILCLDLVNQLYTQTECYCEPVSDSNIFKFEKHNIANDIWMKVPCDDVLGNINLDQVMLSLIDGGLKVEDMKFDAVVGNPPYNDDIYIDFVNLGFELLKDNGAEVMVTPAKWQAKGGDKNEQFRRDIVPYMSKLVYYPYTDDVFDVTEVGGITYYIIVKSSVDKLKVSIKKNTTSVFHREETFEICTGDKRFTYYDHVLEDIVAKAGVCGRLNNRMFSGVSNNGDYMVRMSHLADDKRRSSCIGGFITTPAYVEKYRDVGQNMFVVARGSKEYCESFKSYIYTKFVRFLVALGMCASSVRNVETWRFVPDPGAFDHIFTDEELYKKYNLTDEEINIIESVIKERK